MNAARSIPAHSTAVTSIPARDTILGVDFKALKSFPDQRGFFREVVRVTDPFFCTHIGSAIDGRPQPEKAPFQQWSHSKMTKNVVKAWHYHHVQFDWWYVPIGVVETVLFDNREESPTYRNKIVIKMGESDRFGSDVFEVCVRIPPGVLHGCKVMSEEAHLFYITSEIYNPNEEGRFPFNSEVVGHDWGIEAITAENDRRTFVPTSTRELVSSR